MPIFNIYNIFPNLILISVVLLALLDFQEDALLLAGVGGLVYDFYSPIVFGINTIYYFIIIYLINFLAKRYFPNVNILIVILIVLFSNLIYSLMFSLFLSSFSLQQILIVNLYAIFLAIIVYFILLSINKPKQIIKVER